MLEMEICVGNEDLLYLLFFLQNLALELGLRSNASLRDSNFEQ